MIFFILEGNQEMQRRVRAGKRIKMSCVHGPTPHNEQNRDVQQTGTDNKNF